MPRCVLALGLGLVAVLPARAEDFTFRRVRVGDNNPQNLITVQIDPVEQARVLAAGIKVDPAGPLASELPPVAYNPLEELPPNTPTQAARYAWFWDLVPTGLYEGEGRFQAALAALAQAPEGAGVAAPRLQSLQNMASAYGTDILRYTVGTRVSPALVLAVMAVESAGDPAAQSSAGAQGLMQLIPATAKRFGVRDALDARQNIKGGVAYLDWLMGNFNRDPLMVLAGYNAGEGAVSASMGVPPYAETRDYIPKVLAAWTLAQGLCLTRPEFFTDPCVFTVISAQK